jgi:hypothetical protein
MPRAWSLIRRCSQRAGSGQLITLDAPDYACAVIDLNYPEAMGLQKAVQVVSDQAIQAVCQGNTILVLSDRLIEPSKLPIHACSPLAQSIVV